MRRFFSFCSLMATTLIFVSLASAVTTSLWEQHRSSDFEAGEIKNISVSSQGDAKLSFKIEDFSEVKEAQVWALAEDSEGNIYAGTGNEGKIYKISADGKTSELYYDSPEVTIFSLVVGADDTLYAGTGPDGLVYKITDEKTPPETILSEGDKYVWAMHLDDDGNLYAATGTEGKIYKITPDGESSVFFDTEEKNISSLVAFDGGFYAGSSGNGIIYKIMNDGTANVIYQAKEKEIRDLVMDSEGNVYASAVTSVPMDRGGSRQGKGGPAVPKPQAPGSGPPKENKSYIYRLHLDGTSALVWSSPEPLISAFILEKDDQILVGTGSNGKLYRVNPKTGDYASVGKSSGKDIIAILQTKHADDMKTILGAGNPGKLFTLTSTRVEEGTLESSVHNAQSLSRWGKLSWEAEIEEGTSITFATRSGNTRKPDDTWNKWSEELTTPEGSQIPNADGQYIQWCAKFTTTDPMETAVLKKVTLASVQTNVKPKITSISIGVGRSSSQRPSAGPPSPGSSSRGSSAPPSAKSWKIEWKVEDANKDTLQFTVYYKTVDEENWQLLKKELSSPNYGWDITSIADGRYKVKVVATDKLSNPVGWEKSSEKVSSPVNVDNTDPDVGAILVAENGDGTYKITCEVSDVMNTVEKAVYKIDNDEKWKVIFPDDGIFDSKEEQLLLETGKLPEGAHSITIRVTDRAQNVATGRESF